MALMKCGECRKEVSDKASACPHCGAPVVVPAAKAQQASSSGMHALKWIGGLLLFVILIRACSGAPDESAATPQPTKAPAEKPRVPDLAMLEVWAKGIADEQVPVTLRANYARSIVADFPDAPEAQTAKNLLPMLTAQVEEERTNGAWSYSNREDGMSGKHIGQARLESTNTISLDFPYQGAQRGSLILRRHPQWGNNLIVTIEEGQILCSSYDCRVVVRLDDGQPVTYSGTEPADNSSETVFLPYSIVKKLQAAKRVRVQLNVHDNGAQVLEFNVKGFRPERMNLVE